MLETDTAMPLENYVLPNEDKIIQAAKTGLAKRAAMA